MLLIFVSCSSQKTSKEHSEPPTEELEAVVSKKDEPHRYGGWYCPDNFGFVPVDIQKLNEVPAITDRLPTEQELHDNMSLIKVDTAKYPDARALEMDLPRVASIYSERKGMSELIIVIQAIVVQEDTVVGYRFANGGNGSAWLSDVSFLSADEVAGKGAQPFFYSKSVLKAKTEDIWRAISKTDYFKQLGEKFDKKEFFSSEWNSESKAHLNLDSDGEKAVGYVGMVYGNYYLHIDYDRNGFHYSEKLLLMENHEDNTTKLFFASGPYPEDFEKQKSNWANWVEAVNKASEAD
jgi:hypothetical protein